MTRAHWVGIAAVVLALLFAGTAAVTASGSGTAEGAAKVPGTASADAGFARDMAVHHQQAVEMSFIVRDRTTDTDVRRLAYDIANTQANQRGMMLGWLDLWGLPKTDVEREPMAWMAAGDGAPGHGGHGGGSGHGMAGMPAAKPGALMPGMATKAELAALGKAQGKAAEVLFLQLMTDHHKGGVHMAQGCADRCTTPVERDLARGMVEAQQSELDLMAAMLKARGAAPRP
ncbi:DUF305 domain-containing protein [Streptomyces bambusae]|uniref:DUF305 domain-containing protein n=1 Tax=Streptomyces bambusae TaxID=1550616 RepID=UPI001CFFF6E3|nr:DUF305 domain-containing protein [Streptomyces bambusae]MCB5170035.1 DUF305 domain-containing protein [Streptomyces bambusae]